MLDFEQLQRLVKAVDNFKNAEDEARKEPPKSREDFINWFNGLGIRLMELNHCYFEIAKGLIKDKK